ANPYSVLSPHEFAGQVRRQQKFSGEIPKLGLDDVTGWRYYLWTLTWGFGWAPLAAAVVGIGLLLKENWQKAVLLLGFLLVFWFFMGRQERYYARWFLPVYPVLALFVGYAVMRAVQAAPRKYAYAVGVGLTALLVAQGVITSVHNNSVLANKDTRAQAHQFLRTHLPRGGRLVVEPIASAGFARETESLTAKHLWWVYKPPKVQVENYVEQLKPSTLDDYARGGYCVVVVGSTQYGRALKEPKLVPQSIAYYRKLAENAKLVAEFSPIESGKTLPKFNFDWSYDYYPRAYKRPGPVVKIYQLQNGACAGRAPLTGLN
ncbi:MAG: hypothetical protein JHC87_10000, partial [Thermoleophilaceae bacterium]|nr:hypothetical protein [Thermoleophilaceae bacterium]